jgi:D-sedoheptulose 7-phosphate isomerase
MTWSPWLDAYYARYRPMTDPSIYPTLEAFRDLAQQVKDRGSKLMLAGNGASASVAAHGSVDFTKQGKVRAINFNEANLITAYSNDYGYENWVARAIESYGDDGDVVVLISVSGSSPNLIEAANYAKKRGMTVVTFTGKSADNPLKALGDINFWIDSGAYNVVECVHMTWLTTVVDMMIGEAEYSVT